MNDMDYWNKICGFVSIFLMATLCSYTQPIEQVKYRPSSFAVLKLLPVGGSPLFSFNDTIAFVKVPASVRVINQSYYTQHFGFFCKKELAVEKATRIPLRLRLGSLQQCNYLEGKR